MIHRTLGFGNKEAEHQCEVGKFHCGCTHCSQRIARLHCKRGISCAVDHAMWGSPLLSKMAVSLSIHVSSNWKAFEKELQKLLLLKTKYESRRTESNAKKLDVLFRVVLATMVTSALVRQTNRRRNLPATLIYI